MHSLFQWLWQFHTICALCTQFIRIWISLIMLPVRQIVRWSLYSFTPVFLCSAIKMKLLMLRLVFDLQGNRQHSLTDQLALVSIKIYKIFENHFQEKFLVHFYYFFLYWRVSFLTFWSKTCRRSTYVIF